MGSNSQSLPPVNSVDIAAYRRYLPNIAWWIGVVVVLGVALYTRTVAINYGLPQRLHPDEWSQVEIGWSVAQGNLNPGFFRYPSGHIYFTALLFRTMSLYRDDWSLPELYYSARLMSVVFGLATVLVVIVWTRLLIGCGFDLLAGLLLATVYTAAEQAHFAVVDGPLTFWTTITLVVLTLIVSGRLLPERGWLLMAAVFSGIALSTKYSAILLLGALVTAIILLPVDDRPITKRTWRAVTGLLTLVALVTGGLAIGLWRFESSLLSFLSDLTSDGHIEQEYLIYYKRIIVIAATVSISSVLVILASHFSSDATLWQRFLRTRILVIPVIMVGLFVILSPYLIIDWRVAVRDFLYEVRHAQIGTAAQVTEGTAPQVSVLEASKGLFPTASAYRSLLIADWGLLALLLAISGLVSFSQHQWQIAAILLSFILPLGLILLTASNFASRYILVLYPLIALCVAEGISMVIRLLPQFRRLNARFAVYAILLILLLIVPARKTWLGLRNLQRPDNRELAWSWAAANLPEGTRGAGDYDTPDFSQAPLSIPVKIEAIPSVSLLDVYTSEQMLEMGFEYLFSTHDPQSLAVKDAAFLEDYELLAEFTSGRYRPNYVYRVRRQ